MKKGQRAKDQGLRPKDKIPISKSYLPSAICYLPTASNQPPTPSPQLTDPQRSRYNPGVAVKMIYRDKEYEVPAGMTVRDALKKVGLQPETTLAVHEGKLLTDDTILKEGMKLKLVAVISGG